MSKKLKTSITPDPRYYYGCYLLTIRSSLSSILLIYLGIFGFPVWAIIGVKVFWDHPFFSATGSRSHFYDSALESSYRDLQNICWGQGREGYGFRATGSDVTAHFLGWSVGKIELDRTAETITLKLRTHIQETSV